MLTEEQKRLRAGKLTASAVGALMGGDKKKIVGLWRELIGDPTYVRDNLDGIWPVQLGNVTEQLNLDWYERKHGHKVTRRGDVVDHPRVSWAACTLDGWIDALGCPIETKHVGGFEPFQRIVDRYIAQCHWQMDVMGSRQCVFSVIEGAKAPRLLTIERDDEYAGILWDRATRFIRCVDNLIYPVKQ